MNLEIIWTIAILIFSVIIHELAHGYMALRQGDPTAQNAGRLTLNPIPHIDMVGSILLPAFFIITGSTFFLAWAKPVPYNPHNFKNKKWSEALVALAGPASNLLLAMLFLIISSTLANMGLIVDMTHKLIISAAYINIFLAVINLFPIPPLDGSKVLFALLPHHIMVPVRSFMEKNYLLLFILFIFFLHTTSIIDNIVSFIFILLTMLF